MEQFVNKIRLLNEIQWTTTTITICSLPFALAFIVLHLILLILNEQVGSVVSNAQVCSKIGKDVLKDGGSVVDSAIAVLFCESILLPNRVGIGGGFSAIIYMRRHIESITATPKVPYNIKSGYKHTIDEFKGAMAGSVPGTLMGFWQMHRRFGILSWKSLLEPTIALCENGIPRADLLEYEGPSTTFDSHREMTFRLIIEKKRTNETDGEKIKFLDLAYTLRMIAKEGANVFYKGRLGEDFVRDIHEEGGSITMNDLRNYSVSWDRRPISFNMRGGYKAYTTPLPTSGPIVALVMNIIKNLQRKGQPMFWHKVIEAMKHAYGLSFSLADIANEQNMEIVKIVQETYEKMIDHDFAVSLRNRISKQRAYHNLSYYGVKHSSSYQSSSANICISSPNGDAIVLTTDMLVKSPHAFYSRRTGILLNNQLRMFLTKSDNTLPLSPNSFVYAGKRAFSSHSPVIVLHRNRAEIRFLVGASGDESVPAQVITALIKSMLERKNAFGASNSFFFYPDLLNDKVLISQPSTGLALDQKIEKFLQKVGHNTETIKKSFPYSVRTVIGHTNYKPDAEYTFQKDGGTDFLGPKHELNIFLIFIVVGISVFTIFVMCAEIIDRTKRHIAPRAID